MPRCPAKGNRSIPAPPGVIVLEELPPFPTEYRFTADYHWPDIGQEDTNVGIDEAGEIVEMGQAPGPWGFTEALLSEGKQCLVKSGFGHEDDECILNPKDCDDGLSFSIWEKVTYKEDVLNVDKDHEKQYIFSTGGDYKDDKSYPGIALYHEGMNLGAIVSTGEDVYELKVIGQLKNETYSNIAVRWEPYKNDPTLPVEERGGLELYVNKNKVGHAIVPMKRPTRASPYPPSWTRVPPLTPNLQDPSWDKYDIEKPPVMMVGCHRNSEDAGFRDFAQMGRTFDELAIWARKLGINRTHDETEYFMAGYKPEYAELTPDEWLAMMEQVDLSNPGQAAAAAAISAKFAEQADDDLIREALAELEDIGSSGDGEPEDSSGSGEETNVFPRSAEDQEAFEIQKKQIVVGERLVNTDGVLDLERAKYVSRRFKIFPVVGQALEDNAENIAGFRSVQLDPNEDGSMHYAEGIEKYGVAFLGSTNIVHDENYPPYFNASLQDMTIHSSTPAFTMSISKVFPDNLAKNGDRITVREYYDQHPVNPNSMWFDHPEIVELPAKIYFKNDSRCGDKPLTFSTVLYNGLGKMAPLRRNPSNIRAPEIKIDSKPISTLLQVNPDPRDAVDVFTGNYSDCEIDKSQMRYNPWKYTFVHYLKTTSMKKLLWFDNDLDTNIELRRCALFNDEIRAWDATDCTTVLTEQEMTICECSTFGTVAVIAEVVEVPSRPDDYLWLCIVKYVGYVLSLVALVTFIIVVTITTPMWDMFHLLHLNIAISAFFSLLTMFIAEIPSIREDLKSNITISMLQHYWILATACFVFFQVFASFRAVTAGIIEGKTWAYVPLGYGVPFIDLGLTLFLYGSDYGTEPWAFLGWSNDTKMIFFYCILPGVFVSFLLCFIIILNVTSPQTRKDSIIDQLANQSTGLAMFVFYFAMTWGFAYPAYIRNPDLENADFYPIFAILNSWSGIFIFCFLGLSSRKFRRALIGQARSRSNHMLGFMVPREHPGTESSSEEEEEEDGEQGGEGSNQGFFDEEAQYEEPETKSRPVSSVSRKSTTESMRSSRPQSALSGRSVASTTIEDGEDSDTNYGAKKDED